MSASQNPVIHPDENLLAAFAEHALTGTERQSVLSHISGCARCRDIVFLAQAAAPEPAAVQGFAERPARRQWLRWQTATAGAWVLALVVSGALLWHRRENTRTANEQAIVHPAAPPVTSKVTGPEKQVPPVRPDVAARQVPNRQFEAEAKAPEMRKKGGAPRDESVPPAPSRPAVQAQSYIAPPMGAPEQQSALAHSELRSLPMAGKQSVQQQTNENVSQNAPVNAEGAPPPQISAASNQLALAESKAAPMLRKYSSVSASATPETAVSASAAQFSIRQGKLERLDAGSYKTVELPAGTQARSVASYRNVVLLLTTERALYRSVDSGEHWVLVPAQWEGRAATLHLKADVTLSSAKKGSAGHEYDAAESGRGKNAGSTGGAAGIGAVTTAPQSPSPVAEEGRSGAVSLVFELTNGVGKRWLSRDEGQSWQPE